MRATMGWIVVALFAGAAQAAGEGAAANSCSDPYWTQTLRCRALAIVDPEPPLPPPQPVPAPPASPAAIGDYVRVELPDPDVRCLDGTRPIVYVDPAVGGASNRWLVVMTGGDHCAAEDLDRDGTFESGQACAEAYVAQNGNLMGTAGEPSTSNLVDPDGSGNGILKPDPSLNPVFADYHRVRIHKCGYDRHSGRATHPGVTASAPGGGTLTYDLYSHGQKIVLEALETLRGDGTSFAYPAYAADGGDVVATTETLPSIALAEQVILVGHSAAAHGLYQNADRYADALRAMPGFAGDVRAIHDAQFQPAAENEAAFDPAQNPDPAANDTLFDQRTTGTTDASGAYDAERLYGPGTFFSDDYRAWLETPGASLATVLDASCVETHTPTGDAWKCVDRLHVRFHHESTPALLREDISDPNFDHNNLPFGHIVFFGETGVYPHCDGAGADLFPFAPCPPTLTPLENRERLLVQATHFLDGLRTRSELANDVDPSADPGTVHLWLPDCGAHGGVYDDVQFFGASLAQGATITSYREFVEAFAQGAADAPDRALVHGLDGVVSECAPLLLRDSFE